MTKYSVCLSFAGEQRQYVKEVADWLKTLRISCFYDEDELADLWGKELSEHLDDIYRNNSRFCVMFVSSEYVEKMWTIHERRSALARRLQSESEYVLPARFDNTDVPGLPPSVGFIDLTKTTPRQLADLIAIKCNRAEDGVVSSGAATSIQGELPFIVTAPDEATHRELPFTWSQTEITVLVQGRSPQAVILRELRPVVVARRPVRRIPMPPEYEHLRFAPLSVRPFWINFAESSSQLLGGSDAVGFPFRVHAGDPEWFEITAFVSPHEVVEWRLELDWICVDRSGTVTMPTNGGTYQARPPGWYTLLDEESVPLELLDLATAIALVCAAVRAADDTPRTDWEIVELVRAEVDHDHLSNHAVFRDRRIRSAYATLLETDLTTLAHWRDQAES